MLAGVFHAILGLTGVSGWILKFIGPLTIVPTMLMMIIFYAEPVLKFIEVSWGISMSTTLTCVILFLYLSKYNTPTPVWTPSGQFGTASFNGKAFLSFLIATLLSVIDSIGDYYACARVSRVPGPPTHAINRGILVEGMCTIMSGALGCGVSQTTFGSSIGAIGVTNVASRIQFVFSALVLILFGKVSAFFISIPYPVLGGATIVLSGLFFGVIISNLQVTDMSSARNVAFFGLSTFIGLLVPTWASKTAVPLDTGAKEERGIAAWQVQDDVSGGLDTELYDEGLEVYRPLCPESILSSRLTKYIPFLPTCNSEGTYQLKRRHKENLSREMTIEINSLGFV